MAKKKLNLHAGHNPDGKVACGAVGWIKESTEARNVLKALKKLLKDKYTIYDCTCNNGKSQNDVLYKIVTKCNKHDVEFDLSIHFNAYKKEQKADGKTKGVEVLTYNKDTKTIKLAKEICSQITKLGFTNRGVKQRPDLYYLRNTKDRALLIECCFVDDRDDTKLYNADKMAKAIATAIKKVVV